MIRWLAVHGFLRFVLGRAAAAGDLQARVVADPRARADPSLLYAEIRARGRLVRGRLGVMTVDHAVVHDVLRSDDFRTVVPGSRLPRPLKFVERTTRGDDLHPLRPPSLLSVEPPEHTRYRRLVSSVFTARAVASMRDNVERTANELLDGLPESAQAVDIVERYCAQLPVTVIADILGVPPQDRSRVLQFGEAAAPSLDLGIGWKQFVHVERGLTGFNEWLSDHMEALRRAPGDDLMSQLIHVTDDGGASLEDDELRAVAGLVLAAGFETTVNILGSGIDLLLKHPDQRELLRARPDLWPNAVDEMLRLRAPVQLTGRAARRSTEIQGEKFRAGTVILLVLAGANRDPSVFDDPDRFDVARPNAGRHHSFSGGRHFCLGSALARTETEVGLRTLFDRFPDLAAAGPAIKRDTRVLDGFAAMPVALGSRGRVRSN